MTALLLASVALARPPADYTAVRRAVFLNVYEAKVSLRNPETLVESLGRLRPPQFTVTTQQRLKNDIHGIKQEKQRWLVKHREAAHKDAARQRAEWAEQGGAALVAQRELKPFFAPLPPGVAVHPGDAAPIVVADIDPEIAMIEGKTSDDKKIVLLMRAFTYHGLKVSIDGKREALGDRFGDHPDQGFQVLRWAIFQNAGQVAGDQNAVQQGLDRLADLLPKSITPAHRAKALADLPRLIRLRRAWLGMVVSRLRAGPAEGITVRLPEELDIETKTGVVPSEQRVPRRRLEELTFELEDILGRATVGDILPNGSRDKAACLVRAKLILATLDATPPPR